MRFRTWFESQDQAAELAKQMHDQGLNVRQIQTRLRMHHGIGMKAADIQSMLGVTSPEVVQTTLAELPDDLKREVQAWFAAKAMQHSDSNIPERELQMHLRDRGYMVNVWDVRAAFREFRRANPELRPAWAKPAEPKEPFNPMDPSKYSASAGLATGGGRRNIRGTASFS